MQLRTDMAVQFFTGIRQFYQRHYSAMRLAELVVIVKSIMLVRWIVDSVRLHLTHDAGKRAGIAADVAAWQRVFCGPW
jgi:hypothetical protein